MGKIRWSSKGRQEIQSRMSEIKDRMSEFIHYPLESDKQIIEFVLTPAVTLSWSDEKPVWAMVIGAPSSAKTLHVELLRTWDQSKFLSSLTENALISGYRDANDPDKDFSILPELDGKVLIIKDFTTVMELGKDKLRNIMGQFRDIYDGDMSRALGNVGIVEHKSRFNTLFAVTPVIDSFYSVYTQLGERFISRREYSTARYEATLSAIQSLTRNNPIKGKITHVQGLVKQFVSDLPRNINFFTDLNMGQPWFEDRATKACDFAALARSHVVRDSGGENTASIAVPELGCRLGIQIVQCVAAYQVLNGLESPNEAAWAFGGARVLRDTLPMSITTTLYMMYRLHKELKSVNLVTRMTQKEVMELTRIGHKMTRQILQDMRLNGIIDVEMQGNDGFRGTTYFLSDKTVETLEQIKLFDDFVPTRDIAEDFPERIQLAKEQQRRKHSA